MCLRSQLIKTTMLFLAATNEFTLESSIRYRSPDCLQRVFPVSLGREPRGIEAYTQFIRNAQEIMPAYHLEFLPGSEPIVEEQRRKVAMHLRSRTNTTVGPYTNEYMAVLSMNEDGTVITDIVEFVDSLYTETFWAKARNTTAKQ